MTSAMILAGRVLLSIIFFLGGFDKITHAKSVMSGICLSLVLLGRTEPVLDEPLAAPT